MKFAAALLGLACPAALAAQTQHQLMPVFMENGGGVYTQTWSAMLLGQTPN